MLDLDKTLFPDLQSFTDYLAQEYEDGNPVMLVYQRKTELIEPYTNSQQLVWEQIKRFKTYKPITNIITSSNDLSPNIDIVYYKDLESVLNQINNAILSQGSNV